MAPSMVDASAAELHPDVTPLAPLLGTWSGRGRGRYPTIEPFEYHAEMVFSHLGKPFVVHNQRTRHAGTGLPSHTETGYWRVPGPDGAGRFRLELILAQPTGVAEVHEGTLDVSPGPGPGSGGGSSAGSGGPGRGEIDLRTTAVIRSGTAKEIVAVTRSYTFDGDELHYRLAMAAVGQPLTNHLEAVLHRTVPSG